MRTVDPLLKAGLIPLVVIPLSPGINEMAVSLVRTTLCNESASHCWYEGGLKRPGESDRWRITRSTIWSSYTLSENEKVSGQVTIAPRVSPEVPRYAL